MDSTDSSLLKSGEIAEVTSGAFTISLDFELMWGVFDKRSVAEYGHNIEGTRDAISKMLGLFAEFDVGVTWATVGLLLCRDRHEMIERMKSSGLHKARPDVVSYIQNHVGADLHLDPYHFGADIVKQILATKRQELASHSFSHYGVQEPYASIDGFKTDIQSMKQLFSDLGQPLYSHIFARNQLSKEYVQVISESGFKAYRGNPLEALYSNQSPGEIDGITRIKRLLDSYLPMTNISVSGLTRSSGVLNIVASRFLRPWSSYSAIFQPLQLARIRSEMTYAAMNSGFYHLWWHPHNFGVDIDCQVKALKELLMHYAYLNKKYAWKNRNMAELAGCGSLASRPG